MFFIDNGLRARHKAEQLYVLVQLIESELMLFLFNQVIQMEALEITN